MDWQHLQGKKSALYPDGAKEEYTYYKDNLLHTLANKRDDGTVIESYSYSYDSAHNQNLKVDKKGATNTTYDRLNRLETVKEPNGKLTAYKYDGASNRSEEAVTFNGSTSKTIYEYNSQNRLISTTTKTTPATGATDVVVNYVYDNNGNLIYQGKETVKPRDATRSLIIGATKLGDDQNSISKDAAFYKYDEFNRMIKTTTGDQTVQYTYNAEGYRVEKSVDQSKTRHLYEGDKVILEVDGSGNQTARNIYGTNLITRKVDGKIAYYMYNGHADVTALIDGSGILASYYYDAFGNITENVGDIDNPYKYAGYQYDEETGVYYLNARYYDPKIARFLSEDTFTGKTEDPLSLNLYTYCHNEPLMYSDLTGHSDCGATNDDDTPDSDSPTRDGEGNLRDSDGNIVGSYYSDSEGNVIDVLNDGGDDGSENSDEEVETKTDDDEKKKKKTAEKIKYDSVLGTGIEVADEVELLSYEGLGNFKISQYDWLGNLKIESNGIKNCGPTLDEAADIADNVYYAKKGDPALAGGWQIDGEIYEPGSLRIGVYGREGADGKREYVIANAGTVDIPDWINNGQQPFGESVDMQKSIAYARNFVKNKPDANITFVGHSKGGAESAANAVATNRNAILFNPATVMLSAYGLDGSKYNAKMTAYIVEGEILHNLEGWFSTPIDDVVYLPMQYSIYTPFKALNIYNSIQNHLMDAVKQAIEDRKNGRKRNRI